jgi:hypothetical protein
VDFLAAWHGAQGGRGAGGNEGRSYCSSCGSNSSNSSNSSSSVGPPASKQAGPACEPVACFYTAAPSFKGDGVAEGRCLAHVEVSRRSACVCVHVCCA